MRNLLFLLLACCGSVTASELAPGNPDVIGEAFSKDSGELLYREHHYCNSDGQRCEVLYIDTLGEIFARKELDYSVSEKSPGLRLQDFRSEVDLQLAPSMDPQLVVDAGFDNYVRLRWDDLLEGDEVRFPFLVAGRDEPLAMRAGPGREAECDPRRVCLQIELDSWLLGMLVDPFELTYDRGSRRLLRFTGVSNIKDDEGKSQQVDIHYRYPEERPRQEG
jgi:hypothetical protein